jgi:NarL family two-component system response regulator LiaR
MMEKEKLGRRMCVAVVDDDEDVCLYFKEVIQSTGDFYCGGCFSNAALALAGIPLIEPALAIMDICLPGLSGIECAKQLKLIMPHLQIIAVTASNEASLIEKSLEAGADAFLTKPVTPAQCLSALKFAIAKRRREEEPEKQREGLFPSSFRNPLLTSREKEVMKWLEEGLLYKEIADKMGISFSAVHKHQHNIFKKLRVTNRTEAIRKWHAIEQNFVLGRSNPIAPACHLRKSTVTFVSPIQKRLIVVF